MGTNPQNEPPLQDVMDALHAPPFNVNLVAGPYLVRYHAEWSVEVHGVMFCATLRTVAHQEWPSNQIHIEGWVMKGVHNVLER